MALVNCEDCGKSISNKADACINCGCPLSEIQKPLETNTALATSNQSNSLANQQVRLCKKCSVVLPTDREDFLCSSCRERRKSFIKNTLIGLGVATAATVAAALIKGSSSNSDDYNYDHDYDDYDGEDDDYNESLNVWDAADIYYSNGCDEDYQFGYSHEELENAFYD